MKDYVAPSKASSKYPLSNYLPYEYTTPSYHSYLAKFSTLVELQTFNQEAKDERWIKAIQHEIQALENNKTWEVVDLPAGKNTISSKWVYKIKYQANSEVERFKDRLVVQVYRQQKGLDYHNTFSPVAKMVAVKSVIALAVSKGWTLYQIGCL